MLDPSATHVDGPAQPTANDRSSAVPTGVAAVRNDQPEPALRSMSAPSGWSVRPTAVQFAPTHDTPPNKAKSDCGLGAAWVDHVAPFQCSTSSRRPPLMSLKPVAVHA